jgi:hypothetical protein
LKRLTIQMQAITRQGDTFDSRVSFRRIPSASDGRDFTSATVRVLNEAGTYSVVASALARLGKSDAAEGRYNFWAGARIAFERALDRMRLRYHEPVVREVRHAVQIEMALVENDEAGQRAHEKLMRLSAQRDSLLAEKYALLEPLPNVVFDDSATELAERAQEFTRRAMSVPEEILVLPEVKTPVPEPDFRASTPRDTKLGRACGGEFGIEPAGFPPAPTASPSRSSKPGRACGGEFGGMNQGCHAVLAPVSRCYSRIEPADPYGKSIALLEALLGPDDTFAQTGDPASVDAVRLGLQILKALQIERGVKL